MDDPRQTLGELGERLACEELRRRGYDILECRYRTPFGEIDIVAREDDVTVFVEVKTRQGVEYGAGADAVTRQKQRRVSRMALEYAWRHGLEESPCRFDVVAVDASVDPPRVEVYVHAFDAVE